MYNAANIHVLEPIYVIGQNKIEQKSYKKKMESTSNEMALIISCVIKFCPEIVSNLSESKFMLMQDEILKILRRSEMESGR